MKRKEVLVEQLSKALQLQGQRQKKLFDALKGHLNTNGADAQPVFEALLNNNHSNVQEL